MSIQNFLIARQERINGFLHAKLPSLSEQPSRLHEAMHYAVLNGGKRIRPILVYATGEMLGVDLQLLDAPACSVELIHAYSLVHDDLPAMDNDKIRRGKPTCHIAFDEATALLVGDALQTLAFQVLSEENILLSPQSQLSMVSCLSRAAGSLGMAGGQAMDLRATGCEITELELKQIHALKTGALILTCVQLGALLGNVNSQEHSILSNFASHIGLCFQIQDDILNAEGSVDRTGKGIGTDASNQKATFATLSCIGNPHKALEYHYNQAIDNLSALGNKTSLLKAIADYIIYRDH